MKKTLIEKMLFDSTFDALSNMKRWNGKPTAEPINVATHSHFVSMFTAFICERAYGDSNHMLKYEALLYATFHDFDEVFTGDILHPFKHSEIAKKSNLDKILKEYCEDKIDKLFDSDSIPYFNKVAKSNVHPATRLIVKLADIMSMLQYCNKQHRMGNTYFNKDLRYCVNMLLAKNTEVMDCFANNGNLPNRPLVFLQIHKVCQSWILNNKTAYNV